MGDDEIEGTTGTGRGAAEPDDGTPAKADGGSGFAPRSARRGSAHRRQPASGRRSHVPSPGRSRTGRAARAVAPSRPAAVAARRALLAFGTLALIVVVIAFGVWSTLFRAAADVPTGRSVTITVATGASGATVGARLARAGVVANATMFRIQAQLLGATTDMLAGTYTFKTGSDYEPVIRQLQAGPQITYVTITIPEGWGIPAIAARVQADLHIPASTFVTLATTGAKRFHYSFLADDPTDSLEGYLFPKTYQFKVGSSVTATSVIDVMLAQYGTETAGLDYSYARSKGLTQHNVLTIASIIEREASVASDRPKVSSVIYNRLAIGMPLQLDSTVQYALDGKANLTLADLQTNSPYNTYQHVGLPPGPISDPGLVSIQAALHPAITKYLYYILTYKDGRQSFATNYADFLKLKAQFEKGLK